jgi:hypothetical protein
MQVGVVIVGIVRAGSIGEVGLGIGGFHLGASLPFFLDLVLEAAFFFQGRVEAGETPADADA